jgi:hypothetical protein
MVNTFTELSALQLRRLPPHVIWLGPRAMRWFLRVSSYLWPRQSFCKSSIFWTAWTISFVSDEQLKFCLDSCLVLPSVFRISESSRQASMSNLFFHRQTFTTPCTRVFLIACILNLPLRVLLYNTKIRDAAMETSRADSDAQTALMDTIKQLEKVIPTTNFQEHIFLHAITSSFQTTIGREVSSTSSFITIFSYQMLDSYGSPVYCWSSPLSSRLQIGVPIIYFDRRRRRSTTSKTEMANAKEARMLLQPFELFFFLLNLTFLFYFRQTTTNDLRRPSINTTIEMADATSQTEGARTTPTVRAQGFFFFISFSKPTFIYLIW